METVWESLAASGPLAVTLGAGLVVLWRRLQQRETELTELHRQRVEDLKELLKDHD